MSEKRASSDDGDSDSTRLRRLGAIQQAVFGSAAVASTSFANASKAQSPEELLDSPRSSFGYDSTNHNHTNVGDTTFGASTAPGGSTVPGSLMPGDSTAPSHMGRPTTVKYSFHAEDPAELSVTEGDRVNVLEEAEDEQWWYVRDAYGKEGVVPASYIW